VCVRVCVCARARACVRMRVQHAFKPKTLLSIEITAMINQSAE
jgi:hypothetical protein